MRRLLLLAALASGPVLAQVSPSDDGRLTLYEVAVDSARALAAADRLDASVALYAEAMSGPVDRWDAYRAARTAARAGRVGRAFGFLHQAIEAGHAYPGFAELESDLAPLRAHADLWAEAVAAFHRQAASRHAAYDKALARDLTRIYVDDQRIRRRWTAAGRAHGYPIPGSILVPLRAEMSRVDSVALAEVQAILDARGWPGLSEVGEQGATAVFAVIQHAPHEVQQRYLPVMEAAVEAGEAEAANFVLLVDRVRVGNGQPQLYGTQRWTDPETGAETYFPVEDGIDDRLGALGLGTFREAVERRGHAWPPPTGWRPED